MILVECEMDEAEVMEDLPLKRSQICCPLQTTDCLQQSVQQRPRTIQGMVMYTPYITACYIHHLLHGL